MQDYIYEWDENKNRININKHGVSFEEARTIFGDNNIIFETDDEHSFNELREVAIGMSTQSNILYVCHCDRGKRDNKTVIRIFSARIADRFEIEMYIGGIYETIY